MNKNERKIEATKLQQQQQQVELVDCNVWNNGQSHRIIH